MPRKKIFNNLNQKQEELKMRLKQEDLTDSFDEDFLRERIYLAVKSGKMKKPKDRCPICFNVHFASVPDDCWKIGSTTKVLPEFENYLRENKKGNIR